MKRLCQNRQQIECKEQEKRSKTLEEVFLEWSIIQEFLMSLFLLKRLMERVGHVDESITLQMYSHVSNAIQIDIRDKLNANPKSNQKLTIADNFIRN